MHTEARAFVSFLSTQQPVTVVEIGSRYINGTIRDLFPNAKWTGIDLYQGRCVDWVGDALDFTPPEPVDLVICCEVFEHAAQWQEITKHSVSWLKHRGLFVMTCAGPGRKPHSHVDGGRVRPDEHYANISSDEMNSTLKESGLYPIICRQSGTDTQALAIKETP